MIVLLSGLLGCADGFSDFLRPPPPEPINDPEVFLEALLNSFCPIWLSCQDAIPPEQEPAYFVSEDDCRDFLFGLYTTSIDSCTTFDPEATPDCLVAQRSQSCFDVGYPIPECADVFEGDECRWYHQDGAF